MRAISSQMRGQPLARESRLKRRGRDSNPRTGETRSAAFKAAAFDHSATPPGLDQARVAREIAGARLGLDGDDRDPAGRAAPADLAQLDRRSELLPGRGSDAANPIG